MKKKKGSTLITVVALFAVIFTVGTSVLALTASSYKSRIIESRRVENLYSAESGLDIAYSITGKVVEQAIKKGNSDVNSLLTAGSVDQNTMNTTFQNSFRQVITSTDSGLADCITRKRLLTDATSNPKQTSDISNQTSATFTVDLTGDVPANPSYYNLKVTSSYQVNSSTGTEHRQIQSNYKITVPTYSGAYGKQSKKVSINVTPIMKYILAADGDLNINGVQTFNVGSDRQVAPIFIKGNELDDSIANKYNGGISIGNTSNVKFNGNVVTSKTFKFLSSNDNVSILGGNLYANNIYAVKDGAGSTSVHTLQIGKEYNGDSPNDPDYKYALLDNDVTINDSYSNINISGGLYAVSDISDGGVKIPSNKNQKERSSSSIIINSTDDTSSLTINKQAYIMGSAYINTNPTQYQTGESVAIKGNYNAYTTIISEDDADYFLKYYEPLQLINRVDIKTKLDNLTVVDKSVHFYNYSTNEEYKGNLLISNKIKMPIDTWSTGAYISNGEVHKSFLKEGHSKDSLIQFYADVDTRQREYANNVYEMGQNLDSDGSKYRAASVEKTVASEVNLDSNNINPNGISSHTETDVSKDIIIINPYNSAHMEQVPSDVYIKGNGSTIPTHEGDIVISGSDLKGIIVTAGNVYIDGSVNFKGTIISKKDINISGTGKSGGNTINLTYDANYLNALIAKNTDIFTNIFVASANPTSQTVTVSDTNTTSSVQNAIDPKQYISKGVWKINQ